MHWSSVPMTTDRLTDETIYMLTDQTLQAGSQQSVEALRAWSLLQAEKYRETIAKRRCLAEAQQIQTDKDRQDAAAQLAAFRSEQKTLPRPSWARAILFLAATIVGLVAEFALTWNTLPFLLDLKKSSLIAILLSLSPVAATFALDIVFDRLIEHPWRRAHEEGNAYVGSADQRMHTFLTMLGTLILVMFFALGLARIDGVHWQSLLANGMTDSTLETAPLISIDVALITFSIGVLLMTALLLMVGLYHARLCAHQISLARRIRRQTSRFLQVRQAADEAAAEATRWRMKDAQSNRLTVLVAQWLFACQMNRLKGGHSPDLDLVQQVERGLSHLSLSPGTAA